jgi:Uma2 family endonuclease
MVFGDAHYKLWPERNDQARIPDISFVVKSRLPEEVLHYPSMAPDLAIEILSPTDNFFDVMDKVDEYLEQGTKIVWLLIPRKEEVLICTAEGKHSVRDVLTAPELLPDFKLCIRDFFAEVKAAVSR